MYLFTFQRLKYISSFFWPQVTNYDVRSKLWKNDFLDHCSLTKLFHDIEKLRQEKKKHDHEGYTKILVCTTYRLNIEKKKKKCNFGKILQFCKNLGMFWFLRFWDWIFATKKKRRKTLHTQLPPCLPHQGRQDKIQGQRYSQPKKFKTAITTFFWLRVELFGRLAEISLNQFKHKYPKITLHGNWNCSAPNTGT